MWLPYQEIKLPGSPLVCLLLAHPSWGWKLISGFWHSMQVLEISFRVQQKAKVNSLKPDISFQLRLKADIWFPAFWAFGSHLSHYQNCRKLKSTYCYQLSCFGVSWKLILVSCSPGFRNQLSEIMFAKSWNQDFMFSASSPLVWAESWNRLSAFNSQELFWAESRMALVRNQA